LALIALLGHCRQVSHFCGTLHSPSRKAAQHFSRKHFATCDSSDVDPGLLIIELVVSNDVSSIEVFDLGEVFFSEPTSNITLSGSVVCFGPVEPIEQDCLYDSAERAEYCIYPESVLPGVNPASVSFDVAEEMGPHRVIVSLSGGDDPATETLVRFPMDGPPFAFFCSDFQSLDFDVALSVSIVPTENGFVISDLPIVVNDSETLLQIPAGAASDGTPVPAATVPLTGVAIEIGNQGAATTSTFDAQSLFRP